MKKIILLHIILSILFISCTSNTILEKPDDLIPPDKMEDLLVDLFIASAGEKTGHNQKEKDKNLYFNVIYKKYNVDSTLFRKSNYYYTSQIDDYHAILNNVKKRLTHKNDSISNIIRKNDSIRMTLSEKQNRINKDKKNLENYKQILISSNSLMANITKDRDSLANTSTPLIVNTQKEINNTSYNNLMYGNIDTLKYLQNIEQKENEIKVLSLIKKRLNNRKITLEINRHIALREDSVLDIKRLLKLDTILYFPITTQKDNKLDYLKSNNYIDALNKLNIFFKNEEKHLKEDLKVQDSIYKKLKKDTKGINSLKEISPLHEINSIR